MVSAAGVLAVVIAGSVAWALHRPEKHLIRPARIPLPADQSAPSAPAGGATLRGPVAPSGPNAIPAKSPQSPEAQPGESASHSGGPQVPGPPSRVSAPPSTSPREQASPTPAEVISAPMNIDGVMGAEGQPKTAAPKKKRRVRVHQEVEMTPDGVPLLR